MKIIKKTDSKKKFVKKIYPIVDEVVKKLGECGFRKVVFLFTENPKKAFLDVFNPKRMPHGRQYGKMELWISESVSSFSIQEGKDVKIMINIKDPFIRDLEYARGLIAHEYMHAILKYRGIEPRISKVGGEQWPFIIKTLERIGENYEDVLTDLIKLVTFLILCMKDLIVDTVLIENGFEKEIMKQRKLNSVAGRKRLKVDKKNLVDIMTLYIGFQNMWIPFRLKYKGFGVRIPFKIPEQVERECNKVIKELEDVRPGARNHSKEIREVVLAGLEAYRKLYKKLKK